MRDLGRVAVMTVWTLTTLARADNRARASDGESYTIEQSAAEIAVGAPGKVNLTVVGKNGWHVNADAPITLSLVPDDGITLAKARLTRGDLAESSKEKARFEVAFTAATAGKKTITADTRFVMCQEQACKPIKETVTLALAIAEPKSATAQRGLHGGNPGVRSDKADKSSRPDSRGVAKAAPKTGPKTGANAGTVAPPAHPLGDSAGW